MTVVAYRAGFMAADREAGNTYMKFGRTTKIHAINDCLVGCCGDLAHVSEWLAWFRAGAKPEQFPSSARDRGNGPQAMVVGRDGKVWLYQHSPYPFRKEEEYVAIGCGFEAAMAAMYCGRTALGAVEVAIALCQGVGGGTDVLSLADIDAPPLAS